MKTHTKLLFKTLLLFTGLTFFSLNLSQAQQVNVSGIQGNSATKGKLKCAAYIPANVDSCGYVPAQELGSWKAPLPTDCPAGTFFDSKFGGECWTCPKGYIRSTLAVDSEQACWYPITEKVERASFEAKHGCPTGTFFDPRNGGECWSCPSGFNRTWDPVHWGTACSKSWAGPFSKAAKHAKKPGSCPGGSFFDPIDGGTCWSCPSGYRRTLYSVKDYNACAKTIGTQYARATMVKNMGCNPTAAEQKRLNITYDANGAVWQPGAPQPFADLGLGKCYTCPTVDNSNNDILLTLRSGEPANKSRACTVELRWQPGVYPTTPLLSQRSKITTKKVTDSNGKFFTVVADDSDPVAVMYAQVLSNTELVTEFLVDQAKAENKPVEAFVNDAFNEIIKDPVNNPYINGLLFFRLLAALQVAEKDRDPVTNAFIKHLETEITNRRSFVAADNLKMYDDWAAEIQIKKQMANRSSLMQAFDFGNVPPDFVSASFIQTRLQEQGITNYAGIGAAMNFAHFSTTGAAAFDFTKTIMLGRNATEAARWAQKSAELARTGHVLARSAADTYRTTAFVIKGTDAARGLSQVTSSLRTVNGARTALNAVQSVRTASMVTGAIIRTTVLSNAALTVVTAGLSAMADALIKQVTDIHTMRPMLNDKLTEARKKVNLATMAKEAPANLTYWWALLGNTPSYAHATLKTMANESFSEAKTQNYFQGLCAPKSYAAPALSNNFYIFSTVWQGENKVLTVVNDDVFLAPRYQDSQNDLNLKKSQLWKIQSLGGGYFRLTSALKGDGFSLDIFSDNKDLPKMAKTGNYTGQKWKLSNYNNDYKRLTTLFQGDCQSLDIINDAQDNKPRLTKGGMLTGQAWKLTDSGLATNKPVTTGATKFTPIIAAVTPVSGDTYLYYADGTMSRTGKNTRQGIDQGFPIATPGGWKGFPDSWKTSIDAILPFQKTATVYMFKDGQYLRASNGYVVDKGYPIAMPGGWKGLPAHWQGNVDAALFYQPNNRTYLFYGNEYVRLNGVTVDTGYPAKLPGGWLGMPAEFIKGIDAATYRNGSVYMIKGDQYIRFNGTNVAPGYPKSMLTDWPQ